MDFEWDNFWLSFYEFFFIVIYGNSIPMQS